MEGHVVALRATGYLQISTTKAPQHVSQGFAEEKAIDGKLEMPKDE